MEGWLLFHPFRIDEFIHLPLAYGHERTQPKRAHVSTSIVCPKQSRRLLTHRLNIETILILSLELPDLLTL